MKKETLAQVFSSAFCGISKNTLITEHIWMTASDEIYLPTQKLETKEQKCIRDFDQNFYSHVTNISVGVLNKKLQDKIFFCKKTKTDTFFLLETQTMKSTVISKYLKHMKMHSKLN